MVDVRSQANVTQASDEAIDRSWRSREISLEERLVFLLTDMRSFCDDGGPLVLFSHDVDLFVQSEAVLRSSGWEKF